MRSVGRQTLIALKARRTAFRIVTDFLHLTDIDRREGICTRCGAVLPEDTELLLAGLCPRCSWREMEVEESARQWEEEPTTTVYRPNTTSHNIALAIAIVFAVIATLLLAVAFINS